jgi:sulfide:quinone oxidoreductase
VAFVNPSGPVWPLPLYELALMSAQAAYDAGVDGMQIDLFTAESQPLSAFGATASDAVAGLLEDAGIRLHPSSEPRVVSTGHLVTPEGVEMKVDSLVAMPRLTGPAVKGIPLGDHGFIEVDGHCEVPGTHHRVFAAGDAIDFPVKQGGVGSQAADVAAAAIAHQAGLDVSPIPFHPTVHAKLLTGTGAKFLSTRWIGGEGFDSVISDTPVGSTEKVTAAELSPYLHGATASA